MTIGAIQGNLTEGWSRDLGGGKRQLDLLVPDMHCAGCMGKIERGLGALEGVLGARVNLSTKRVSLEWDDAVTSPGEALDALEAMGFSARPFDASQSGHSDDEKRSRELLRALAVSGFAAANVMLLSVSVWSGAQDATRDLFHWISALIALPAAIYAGRPFFGSAFRSLKHGQMNMDVPISLGIILAVAMSLFQTIASQERVYFDASLMLCFFLLAGRYLDHMMRARARSAVTRLLSLSSSAAQVIKPDGSRVFWPIQDVQTGMRLAVAAGERVPVDGRVVSGRSDLDRSIVTGETWPEVVGHGSLVEAGALNLTGALELEVTAVGRDSFLARVVTLMETAEQGKARYVRLADRAARIYSPLVHVAAAATFAGWMWVSGDWHLSLLTAIAVLIITCPCALGLAVPAVQMVASGRLFRRGVMVKDGSALERLAEVDTVVLDKTGTLTLGSPELLGAPRVLDKHVAPILALVRESSHPLARALSAQLLATGHMAADLQDVQEVPGAGLSAVFQGEILKVGSREWCMGERAGTSANSGSELIASLDGAEIASFSFQDQVRSDAAQTVEQLKSLGFKIALLSGDREPAVAAAAAQAGIVWWQSGAKPGRKVEFIRDLESQGRKVLMVGDGINDAPALAAAHASMAPATATDIGRTAAGFVFTGSQLSAVVYAIRIARMVRRLVHQNFALAVIYNLVAVPVAVLGFASPLVAAIAMSSSSILVTANALRLHLLDKSSSSPRDARSLAHPAPTALKPKVAT